MGPMPRHEWDETRLRFEQGPDSGSWGKWVDLRGPGGATNYVAVGSSSSGGDTIVQTSNRVSDMVLYDETGRAILTPQGRAILAIGQ